MSEVQTTEGEVVVRRKAGHVGGRDLEQRRSRPDSSHKGNLKRLKTSSVGGFERWEKENELLWAMLEDETEWLAKLFPDIIITPELFFFALEDGVVLCRLANLIQEKAEEYGKKNKVEIPGKKFKFHRSIQKKNKQLAQFKSRENVQGFLTWCRQLGISDSILFESNDIVEADECREGCREVVICLMEIARRASGRFKFTPIPKLIQLENEIEAEEQEESETNSLDQVDYGSTDEESNDSGHSPGTGSPPTRRENGHCTPGGGKKKQKKQHPKSELDKEVFKIIDNFNLYNIRKIKEGKYLILGKIIFVRMLNGHVLLRIGGGWDTLEHYLLTHLPKTVAENGDSSSEAVVTPSVSKTPQKPQLTKILDKAKKDQQLKATPVSSSPYRPAAAKNTKQQDDTNGNDEKDITSAIRKIEFSVNQNIATRRKNSKALLKETPQKTPSSDVKRGTPDVNQNSISHGDKTPEPRLNVSSPENIPCFSDNSAGKMEDETIRAESGFFEETNANAEPKVDQIEQNGGENLLGFEENAKNEIPDTNEPIEGNADDLPADETVDDVDGVFVDDLHTETTPRESPDIKQGETVFSDNLGNTSPQAEPINGTDIANTPAAGEDGLVIEKGTPTPCNADIAEPEHSPSPEQLSPTENPTAISETIPSGSDDSVTPPVDDANDSENVTSPADVAAAVPATAPAADDSAGSPKRVPSPGEKKADAASPKKKTTKDTKDTKEPGKTKQTSSKNAVAKKEAPASTGTRPKSAHAKPSARPTSTKTSEKNTKRPTSAVKSTTTSSTRTNTTPSTSTGTKRPSPTPATKKPATSPESKTAPSSRPTRPAKTTAPSSAVSKTPTKKPAGTAKKPAEAAKKATDTGKKPGDPSKKPGGTGRPATAPPVRSSEAKGRTVPAKVQSWHSSSRPQTARTTTKSHTAGKDATDGGASSKETGKPSKDSDVARPTSPTKPLVRRTQTKTVTTVKTTRKGATGEPEVKSQTIKKTRTVTEANGKKTTKTTVKEIGPTGRKPLKMTKTETTEANGTSGNKAASGSTAAKTGSRTEKPGTKKPDTKSKVSSRVGSAGPSKSSGGPGTKKPAAKPGAKSGQKVSSHRKDTVPKAKTVKELSNALGLTEPGAAPTPATEVIVPESKPAEEVQTEPALGERTENTSPDEVKNFAETTTDIADVESKVEGVKEESVAVDKEDDKVKEEDERNLEKEGATNVTNEVEEDENVVERQNELLLERTSEEPVKDEDEGFVERDDVAEEGPGEPAEKEPAEQPEEKTGEQTEEKPGEQPEKRTGEQAEEETGKSTEERPGEPTDERPGEPTEEEPGEPTEEKPGEPTEEKPGEDVSGDSEQPIVEGNNLIENVGGQNIDNEESGNGEEFHEVKLRQTTDTDSTEENFVTESHEAVIVEDSEKPVFLEKNDEFVEESEVPVQDEEEQVEEILEDRLDVIQVPPDEVSTAATKFECPEAWPTVSDQREHASSEETGDEHPEEQSEKGLHGMSDGDKTPSPDLAEQVPSVPPQSFVEADDKGQSGIDSNENNNNVPAEVTPETDKQFDLSSQPASVAHDEALDNTPADQANEDSLVDLESDFPLPSKTPQMDFQVSSNFQEDDVSPKDENAGATLTVDDLLG